jgi:hypothetical protein
MQTILNNIKNLTKEKNKDEFIKNYNDSKILLDNIEHIINTPSTIDTSLTIPELFKLLSNYEDKLDLLDVEDFKKLKDLVEYIDLRLQNEIINVTEYS